MPAKEGGMKRAPACTIWLATWLATWLAMPAARAEIHTRVEPGGLVVISNIAPSSAGVTVEAPPRRKGSPVRNVVLDGAAFPRVSAEEQRRRDTDRRAILLEELAAEQAALAGARGEQLQRHQENVAALQRELKSLR
jgi:hypothetical protein